MECGAQIVNTEHDTGIGQATRARPKPSRDPTTLQHQRSPQTYHYATTFTD